MEIIFIILVFYVVKEMFLNFKKGINSVFNEPHIKFIAMEFQSHIVVTSQNMNKKFGAPTPSCFVYKQVNAQPY